MRRKMCRNHNTGTGGLSRVHMSLCQQYMHVNMPVQACLCVGCLLLFLRPGQKMEHGLSFLCPMSLWALLSLLPHSSCPIPFPLAPPPHLALPPHQSGSQGFSPA